MNISKLEAQQSLADIEQIAQRTRKAIAAGVAAPMLILWGIIWMIGYAGTQFFPPQSNILWSVLVLTGVVCSCLLGVRGRTGVSGPTDLRMLWFWFVLFGYAAIWGFLLQSTGGPGFHLSGNQIGAYLATIPMFAYVVGGLWLSRFFVWLGASVTLLTLAGFIALPGWFNLWMAVTGGGALVVSGLYIRHRWK